MSTSSSSTVAGCDKRARVLIVDDHPVFRAGLRHIVESDLSLSVCGDADGAANALPLVEKLKPDLVVVDIHLLDISGIELTRRMLEGKPSLLVLVISMHDEAIWALKALKAGAKGYVMKEEAVGTLVDAIQKVLGGGIFVSPRLAQHPIFEAIQNIHSDIAVAVDRLSAREREVLKLIGKGKSTRDLAKSLSLSVKTVETHQAHIRDKLGLKAGAEVASFAKEWIIAQGP